MSGTTDKLAEGAGWTPVRERWLLLTLAAIQFTTVLDFLIILPLGPQYERVFGFSSHQFNMVVGAYGVSAGITGIAAGFFLDRFDRKWALVWLYLGFGIGTLLCAVAKSYDTLVAARVVAGGFGGVVGAVILAIIGDVVPPERRGRAMGLVMSSFSVAMIAGVPLGLLAAAQYGVGMPFYALAGLCLLVLLVVAQVTPALRGHMAHGNEEHPFKQTWAVLTEPDHQKAFVFMAALTFAGFSVFPTMPSYMVLNVGLTERQLAWIYLVGGLCTVVSMNWIGRWADRAGKPRVFTILSLTAAIPILALTNLPRVSLPFAVAVTTVLMVCMSGRVVPAMAMMTGAVEARYRGGFMSINSAVQQFSMGLASFASGWILKEGPRKEIVNYPISGLVSLACAYGCIYLARFLKPAPEDNATAPDLGAAEML